MNRLSPLAFAAAIVATGLSVMASSQAEAATMHVRYGDLDLTSDAGRATLDKRINHAAQSACWKETLNLHNTMVCRDDLVANAHAQLSDVMQHQAVQLASR